MVFRLIYSIFFWWQDEIIPVSISRRQPALLAQLLAQKTRESSRTMTRPTIHCVLHRHIGHHRVGFRVGTVTRGHEIEYSLVGFGRSARNDNSTGGKDVSSRFASACRSPPRPHGQVLPGNMTVVGVLRKMSSKCPALMTDAPSR
jgi:hypothetical protein